MLERIKNIKVIAMDVDGVMTDGRIIYDGDGREIKFFNVHDGYGIVLARRAGLKTAIISARKSAPVDVRARELKIDKVFQDASPKTGAYEEMKKCFGVTDHEVCFIGDDLPDLCLLKRAGFAVSVPNGHPDAREAAHYVTRTAGGHGAVRELIEEILKGQKTWHSVYPA